MLGIIIFSFLFIGFVAIAIFLISKMKKTEDDVLVTSGLKRFAISNEDKDDQLRVLVSADRVSGTFARDEIAKTKSKKSLTDLTDLRELKEKVEKDLEYLNTLMEAADNFSFPVASGKAAKLQIAGLKILESILGREDLIGRCIASDRISSTKITELLKKPYELKKDAYVDLVHNTNQNSLAWNGLITWVEEFSVNVSEVRSLVEKRTRVA